MFRCLVLIGIVRRPRPPGSVATASGGPSRIGSRRGRPSAGEGRRPGPVAAAGACGCGRCTGPAGRARRAALATGDASARGPAGAFGPRAAASSAGPSRASARPMDESERRIDWISVLSDLGRGFALAWRMAAGCPSPGGALRLGLLPRREHPEVADVLALKDEGRAALGGQATLRPGGLRRSRPPRGGLEGGAEAREHPADGRERPADRQHLDVDGSRAGLASGPPDASARALAGRPGL